MWGNSSHARQRNANWKWFLVCSAQGPVGERGARKSHVAGVLSFIPVRVADLKEDVRSTTVGFPPPLVFGGHVGLATDAVLHIGKAGTESGNQSGQQPRKPVFGPVIFDRQRERLPLADQHHQFLPARDVVVNQIALQEHVLVKGVTIAGSCFSEGMRTEIIGFASRANDQDKSIC